MPNQIPASAPVYDDGSGQLYADTGSLVSVDDVGEMDTGAIGERAAERRIGVLERKLRRLKSQWGGRDDDAPETNTMAANSAHDTLSAAGLINRHNYIGLDRIAVPTTSAATLTKSAERNIWAKAIVLQSTGGSNASELVVTAVKFAGIPITIGDGGIPVQMFDYQNTRYGFATNKPVQTGQNITVDFYNYHSATINVTGGLIADEVDPGVQARLAEVDLIRAATMFGGSCRK